MADSDGPEEEEEVYLDEEDAEDSVGGGGSEGGGGVSPPSSRRSSSSGEEGARHSSSDEEEEEEADPRAVGDDVVDGGDRAPPGVGAADYVCLRLPGRADANAPAVAAAFAAVVQARRQRPAAAAATAAWAAAAPVRALVSAALVVFCEGRRDGWRVDELRYAAAVAEAGPGAVEAITVDRADGQLVVRRRRVAYAPAVAARVLRLTRLADVCADLLLEGTEMEGQAPSAYAAEPAPRHLQDQLAAALAGLAVS